MENEYREDGYCDKLYNEVYDANRRLCERLGLGDREDKDIEIIINNLLDIQEHLCMKLYGYGWQFAKREE